MEVYCVFCIIFFIIDKIAARREANAARRGAVGHDTRRRGAYVRTLRTLRTVGTYLHYQRA